MRILIISDIHSNLTALEAVLQDVDTFDEAWCLGDVVGYGPDPNGCIERVRKLRNLTCILGNHDAAVLGKIDIDAFNHEARQSLYWQKMMLNYQSKEFLEGLKDSAIIQDLTLVHGSPRNSIWEYILDQHTASLNFSSFNTPGCLVGHTHIPAIFEQNSNSMRDRHGRVEERVYQPVEKFILNAGSVGQPRDRDPRACYVVFDSEKRTWQYLRVAYDVESVKQRIIQAGLPLLHAVRLQQGI